ncbi:UNVERIFIED_CONTAM: hypothetical protein BEN50_02305 [Euhalothece sp. KZN 001]
MELSMNKIVKKLDQLFQDKKIKELEVFLSECEKKYGEGFIGNCFFQCLEQSSLEMAAWLIESFPPHERKALETATIQVIQQIVNDLNYVKNKDWAFVNDQLIVSYEVYKHLCRVIGQNKCEKLFCFANAEYLGKNNKGFNTPKANPCAKIIDQKFLYNLQYRVNYRYNYYKQFPQKFFRFVFYIMFICEGMGIKYNMDGEILTEAILSQKNHPELSVEKMDSVSVVLGSVANSKLSLSEMVKVDGHNKYDILQDVMTEIIEDIIKSEDESLDVPTPANLPEMFSDRIKSKNSSIEFAFSLSLTKESSEALSKHWFPPTNLMSEILSQIN